MYTTTEEKLSALKAINTQKDDLDKVIAAMHQNAYAGFKVHISLDVQPFLPPPTVELIQKRLLDLSTDVQQIILDKLIGQRQDLIEKASIIMKKP